MTLNILDDRKERPLLIRAVGDVNFSRGIGERIRREPDFTPLPEIRKKLGEAQLSIFNLECNPLSVSESQPFPGMIAPACFLRPLRYEFDVASIANNHINDAGTAAFLETLNHLDDEHYVSVGGGLDLEEAESMRFVQIEGKRVGIVSCADFVTAPHGEGNHAGANKPGVRVYRPRRLIKQLSQNRKHSDYLVCSIHTGLEFHSYPDPLLMKHARAMIRAGAHIVLIHHAHVPQGIELFEHGIIAYGLGNFIFDIDDDYMQQEDATTDIGLILDVTLKEKRVSGYSFWLAQINADGTTTILTDVEKHQDLYERQRGLNRDLSDPALVRREWKKVCRRYFCGRCYGLYKMMINRELSRFVQSVWDLRRRENRRWIVGAFGL